MGLNVLSFVVPAALSVFAFFVQRSLAIYAEREAERQRERAVESERACAGLRYDLMVARGHLTDAAKARRALRRRCRGALSEARRWKREAVARGWTRGGV